MANEYYKVKKGANYSKVKKKKNSCYFANGFCVLFHSKFVPYKFLRQRSARYGWSLVIKIIPTCSAQVRIQGQFIQYNWIKKITYRLFQCSPSRTCSSCYLRVSAVVFKRVFTGQLFSLTFKSVTDNVSFILILQNS